MEEPLNTPAPRHTIEGPTRYMIPSEHRWPTLADHFASSLGGSSRRYARLCALIIDGKPLGEYRTDISRDRERQKRFEEMQWIAIALVGCDADKEINELRSIPPSHQHATADFEAVMRGGSLVRLELARIVFDVERAQNEYFASIAGRTQLLLEADKVTSNIGTFIYRVYDPASVLIGRHDVEAAVAELERFVRGDAGLRDPSCTGPEIE